MSKEIDDLRKKIEGKFYMVKLLDKIRNEDDSDEKDGNNKEEITAGERPPNPTFPLLPSNQ